MTQRFALTTFKRVFDTDALSETVDLNTLGQGLLRFELKPRLARSEGKRAKKALRIWSPAYYQGLQHRGAAAVIHLSCLVLDFDLGLTPEQASQMWADHHHILHSTWSYTPRRPKFRVCLPLRAPVAAQDWGPVWEWAQRRCGGRADPAPRSPGSTFALPAIAKAERDYIGWIQEGPLLDPLALGLIQTPAAPPPGLPCHPDSHFLPAGDPARRYVCSAQVRDAADWDIDAAFQAPF